MGGIFGVVSKENCTKDLYFGIDYHSHLGTKRGGMAVWNGKSIVHAIHNIENVQFRSKFENDLDALSGTMGIGCISDVEPQPITVRSHLGNYAITTVGRVNNIDVLVKNLLAGGNAHFLEMSSGQVNQTELIASIINTQPTFEAGIQKVHELIDGSCTMLILTAKGIYAARDYRGTTPLLIGKKNQDFCVTFESCAMPNLGYTAEYELGSGEVVLISPDGMKQILAPNHRKKVCAFLWVYYGYPATTYEGVNVEEMRYRSGEALAQGDEMELDGVAGIPDSGVAHAIGYANGRHIRYIRPFVKYTPTWARSFMPQNQDVRNMVAHMKLIPNYELIRGKKLLFCDDSVVRGTQMRETAELLFDCGAKEVHLRSACPPIMFGCKYLNFSTSPSEMVLAARRAIQAIEGKQPENLAEYLDPKSKKYQMMVDWICKELNLTSLKYNTLENVLNAIGLPHDQLCTYCWNGKE